MTGVDDALKNFKETYEQNKNDIEMKIEELD